MFCSCYALLFLFKPDIHEMAFPRSHEISFCHLSMVACITGVGCADAYCPRLHHQLSEVLDSSRRHALMILNTLYGALAAYGLVGLRYTTKRQA